MVLAYVLSLSVRIVITTESVQKITNYTQPRSLTASATRLIAMTYAASRI